MKFKHTDLEIPVEAPFKNCKLGRKVYADALTKIIQLQTDGFVLTIDSEWGTGKTTFIKMWKQLLDNDGYKTLYFNAWVNDFDTAPLVAILSELKTLAPKKSDVNYKNLIKKGAVLTKNVLPALVKSVAQKHIDLPVLTDAIENITKSAVDILNDEVEEYSKKKKGLQDFKNSLEKYVTEKTNEKPLIFFIDELDRCRPHYAVEVLEQIKHFFNVPGIVFILTIDKEQFSGAINGFYGSDKINSVEYLQRFIDIEYTIPKPGTGVFCSYLLSYYKFDDFFDQRIHPELRGEKDAFLKMATRLFEKDNISLRQQAKIMAHARLSLKLIQQNNYLFPEAFFLLIYLRSAHKNLYTLIKNKELSNQEFIDNIGKVFPKALTDRYLINSFIHLEADLVRFYETYVNGGYRESKLLVESAPQNFTLTVTSSFETEDANRILENAFKDHRHSIKNEINLNIFLEKIDLIQQITS